MIKATMKHAEFATSQSQKSSFVTERSGLPFFSVATPQQIELEKRNQRQMRAGRIALGLFSMTAVFSLAINEGINRIETEMNTYYNWSVATFFCITGIACFVMLILLIRIIRKAFTDELNQEMRQLVISEITFVLTFLIRVFLICFV